MSKAKNLSREDRECIENSKLLARCDSAYITELLEQGFDFDTALQMLCASKAGMIDSEDEYDE